MTVGLAAPHLRVEVAIAAVQRHNQHTRILLEDLLRAVAMVDLQSQGAARAARAAAELFQHLASTAVLEHNHTRSRSGVLADLLSASSGVATGWYITEISMVLRNLLAV